MPISPIAKLVVVVSAITVVRGGFFPSLFWGLLIAARQRFSRLLVNSIGNTNLKVCQPGIWKHSSECPLSNRQSQAIVWCFKIKILVKDYFQNNRNSRPNFDVSGMQFRWQICRTICFLGQTLRRWSNQIEIIFTSKALAHTVCWQRYHFWSPIGVFLRRHQQSML